MATTVLPLVKIGNNEGELQPGQVLDGNCNDIVLVARQAGAGLALLATDTMIDGSNYLWENILLPRGRDPYFEVVASGANLGAAVGVVVTLYTAAGVAVPNAAITITSLVPKRTRSIALSLADNTEYVVRYKIPGLLGSAFVYSARILMR